MKVVAVQEGESLSLSYKVTGISSECGMMRQTVLNFAFVAIECVDCECCFVSFGPHDLDLSLVLQHTL